MPFFAGGGGLLIGSNPLDPEGINTESLHQKHRALPGRNRKGARHVGASLSSFLIEKVVCEDWRNAVFQG